MSIPLDRLYHYIENIAKEVRGDDVIIYRFWPHGSKKIEDLQCLRHHTNDENIFLPHLICYDQEPLNYDLYKDVPIRLSVCKQFDLPDDPTTIPKRNLRVQIGNIYDKCLLLHSELNSPEVVRYQQDQFVPVYYWSHAIIARDWFRYAQHLNFSKDIKKTFLIYNRAWSGSREYRLKFTDLLIENNLLEYCKTNFNPYDNDYFYKDYIFQNLNWKPTHSLEKYLAPTTVTSHASADFDIEDYNNTEFEIVLETLFDDQRQQLTEKILRPIACRQPFILASTPGSLKYLQNYGFQTFGSVFDESYDLIQDPVKRMQCIVRTMREITSWSTDYKKTQMKKINDITQFNQEHFFSNDFFNTVVGELKTNLITAFNHIENTTIGTHYLDRAYRKIPGIRQNRRIPESRATQPKIFAALKEYRKRNRKIVK
jgi:hypothetical protein